MYIYLLWSHGEYGPEELKATTDRSKLVDMVKSCDVDGWFKRAETDPVAKLIKIIESPDQELAKDKGIHALMGGWGGLHFQVVTEI